MKDNESIVIDVSRERLVMTHNPAGYLKRVL